MIVGDEMKAAIEHVFDGVGYQEEVDGTLVLDDKRLAYYEGGSAGDQKADVSIRLSEITAVNYDSTKLQIVASQKKQNLTYEFVLPSQNDAMLVADKITKLRSKNQIGKASTGTLEGDKVKRPSLLHYPTQPQEPAAFIIVDHSEATTMPKHDDERERTNRSNNDLEEIRTISKEMNKDRRAKRKAAPKQPSTVPGAEPVSSDRVSQIPPKHGLRRNNAASATTAPKEPPPPPAVQISSNRVSQIPPKHGLRRYNAASATTAPKQPPPTTTDPVSSCRVSQISPKHGLRRNNEPSAATANGRNRPAPPSLTASETELPTLATESPYINTQNDIGGDLRDTANEFHVDTNTNDGGYLVEAEDSTSNQGYLVEATLVPDIEDELQDEEALEPNEAFREEASLVVQAHELGLRDHLQSRKLQFFVVGLFCCFVVVTIIVVVIVIMISASANETTSGTSTGTPSPSLLPIRDLVAKNNLTILSQILDGATDLFDQNSTYTLLAPNDDAFDKINFTQSDAESAGGPTSQTLLSESFSLKGHLVPGTIPSLQHLKGNQFLTLEEGVLLSLSNNTSVISSVVASNGMMYIIDTIIPLSATNSVTSLETCDGSEFSSSNFLNTEEEATWMGQFTSNNLIDASESSSVCTNNTGWALAQEFNGLQGQWLNGQAKGSSNADCVDDHNVEILIKLTMPSNHEQFHLNVKPCVFSGMVMDYEGPRLSRGFGYQIILRLNRTSDPPEPLPFDSMQLQPIDAIDMTYQLDIDEKVKPLSLSCSDSVIKSRQLTLTASQTDTTREVVIKMPHSSSAPDDGFQYMVEVYSVSNPARKPSADTLSIPATTLPPIPVPMAGPASSSTPNVTFNTCRVSMAISDSNRDDLLSQEEYVTFLNRITTNQTGFTTFAALPVGLQSTYTSLSGGGELPIIGASPADFLTATPTQVAALHQICNSVQAALSSDGSITYPPINPVATAAPAPTTMPFPQCRLSLAISDANQDNQISVIEYVDFINRLTQNQYAGKSFYELPSTLIANFNTLAAATPPTTTMGIAGAQPGQYTAATPSQKAFLERICTDTQTFTVPGPTQGPVIGPTTTVAPSSCPMVEAWTLQIFHHP